MARAETAREAPASTRRGLDRVMGCAGSITVVGTHDDGAAERLLTVAAARLRALEARWSRFLPDSEVTRLNTADGRPVAVSHDTRALVRHLVAAWEATSGAFDPTLLPDLVELGYRTSRHDPADATRLPTGALHGYDPRLVEIDDDAGTVRLPAGGTLDPGGLGKGLAADLVAGELLDRGCAGAMVEVGGDLRVAGRSPSGDAWRVAVEDPDDAATTIAVVELRDGGVATSSTRYRRWTGPAGRPRHHLLDPSTGAPSARPVTATTVVTGSGAWSEAFSVTPFMLGAEGACELMDEEGVAALVVAPDGTRRATQAWTGVAA